MLSSVSVTINLTAIRRNRPISQIPQCIIQISHNATFCNRNEHTCAHFCYKMLHCGIWHICILGFVRWVYCMKGMMERGNTSLPLIPANKFVYLSGKRSSDFGYTVEYDSLWAWHYIAGYLSPSSPWGVPSGGRYTAIVTVDLEVSIVVHSSTHIVQAIP